MNKESFLYKPSATRSSLIADSFQLPRNHPAIILGNCTAFKLFEEIHLARYGSVCVIGSTSRWIRIATAMIRRSRKPFLFLGTASDTSLVTSVLQPEWMADSVQENMPERNSAILFAKPYSSYIEMSERMEIWGQKYFLVLHLGSGLQISAEMLNLLNTAEQCLIICDSVPQSIRAGDSTSITPAEFMRQMKYLFVFSTGGAAKDLVDVLPTYISERVTTTTNINSYWGRSFFRLFSAHHGQSSSSGQSSTPEYKKSIFETDEMQKLFDAGQTIIYCVAENTVFIAQLG